MSPIEAGIYVLIFAFIAYVVFSFVFGAINGFVKWAGSFAFALVLFGIFVNWGVFPHARQIESAADAGMDKATDLLWIPIGIGFLIVLIRACGSKGLQNLFVFALAVIVIAAILVSHPSFQLAQHLHP